MRTLKMSWNTEEGRLVCHWVESEEGEKPHADSPTAQLRAFRSSGWFWAEAIVAFSFATALPPGNWQS
jgi:hypothetical protein